jgi:hypothetical protein
MTLQINEINIQISLQAPAAESWLLPSSGGPAASPSLQAGQVDQLVSRCVRDVLQQLRLRERR